jgi:hypothetical protein
MADHFVMVTSIHTDTIISEEEIEAIAWKRLSDEYGDDWVEATKSFINRVSIEGFVGVDDSDVYTIPEAGDPADAGIDGA